MTFLQRRRSLQAFYSVVDDTKVETKPLTFLPSPSAIENVPLKRKRTRTTSNLGTSHIIKRVSTMFSSRRKPAPPDLELVDSVLENTLPRPSFSSYNETVDSEDDDIRIPSGLGSAATMFSNQSFPPSPFYSPLAPNGNSLLHSPLSQTFPPSEYQRTRALSSPNLLRSISVKMRGKAMTRRASIAPASVPMLPRKPEFRLPKEIVVAILSHLPTPTVISCSTVSRTFVSAVRTCLYSTLDFDKLSAAQAEQLVMLLVSRSDLTDLIRTFICRTWPSFFLPNTRHDSLVIHPRATLLTAVFTLALELMSNLITLVLPAFDISLLGHHSAFGLKNLTFLHRTTSYAETQALFTWLDGQTNITALQFPNIEDTLHTKATIPTSSDYLIPNYDDTQSKTAPSSPSFLRAFPTTNLSPPSWPAQSPKSASFIPSPLSSFPYSGLDVIFSSPTLLPNLTELHATPSLVAQLSAALTTSTRRPLRSITLNINTTLYNGLRPAALMNGLHGVTHLSLRFGETVDKRSFEKVLGAAGASLGRPAKKSTSDDPFIDDQAKKGVDDPKWNGLESLEISFYTGPEGHPGRDEALYKSLQASLPRYKSLTSLRLFVLSSKEEKNARADMPKLSGPEQVLLDSWAKLCPTLQSAALFSGARWQNKMKHRVPEERKLMGGFKFPSVQRSKA